MNFNSINLLAIALCLACWGQACMAQSNSTKPESAYEVNYWVNGSIALTGVSGKRAKGIGIAFRF